MLRPIYTEPENCQDCYKCVRECPVKAISVEDNKAYIIDERCIFCGHCTQVCPTGAKKVRDGLTRAKYTVERYPDVYLSLAPSYVSEFPASSEESIVAAIKELGFKGVSETALGAELVSDRTDKFLATSGPGVHISSACPVVVSYICRYAPEYRDRITPVVSPMLAHARMLKELYGKGIKIVFVGPCIAKKSEADHYPDLIDVAITFRDLRRWFDSEGIDPDDHGTDTGETFVPYHSRSGAYYPIEGGMLEGLDKGQYNVRHMAFSDLQTVKDIFTELDKGTGGDEKLFLELLACRGGCVNGPAKLNSLSPVVKRHEVFRRSESGDPVNDFKMLDLRADFSSEKACKVVSHSEEEILGALAAVGKTTPADELNCSGCGYDSCRDFAVAMLDGRAEENMCVSYMRRVAHDKATVLLHKIPAGIVMVNAQLKVMDMNRSFAEAMGPDTMAVYEVRPGMEGASIERLTSFANLFKTVLTTGEEISERKVTENGKTYLLSIHNIQPHQLVFGLLLDMHEPAVHKEWVLDKTREVIRKHMATVQEVARLLGENAAFTDSTLKSVIDSMDNGEQK